MPPEFWNTTCIPAGSPECEIARLSASRHARSAANRPLLAFDHASVIVIDTCNLGQCFLRVAALELQRPYITRDCLCEPHYLTDSANAPLVDLR